MLHVTLGLPDPPRGRQQGYAPTIYWPGKPKHRSIVGAGLAPALVERGIALVERGYESGAAQNASLKRLRDTHAKPGRHSPQ